MGLIGTIADMASRGDVLMSDLAAICDTGGRFAGSDSEQSAQAYLRHRLEEVTGLAPTRHAIDFLGWSRGDAGLERLDNTRRTLPCVSLVRSPATPPGGIIGELVNVGRGTEQNFARCAPEIPGRIVLVQHEYMFATDTIHRRRKYQWALDGGGIGFLIACHLSDVGPVTGSSGATPERGIPAAGISAETAAALVANGPATIRLRIEAAETRRRVENLILDLPGRSSEWVVLSAHIDGHHLAESAIDNATGLAATLSIAEAMAPQMARMKRGLRIALFTVEEWALAGSANYVDGLSDAERSAIKLNVNLDSIAGSAHITALTSGSEKLEQWLLDRAEAHGHAIGVHRPLMANSDHYNFARHGVPATRLVAGFDEPDSELRYVLTPSDTRDRVRPEDLRNATALAATLVAEACRADILELR